MLALLENYESTRNLPIFAKTATASGAAACFRIVLMPVDALKTTLQVCVDHTRESACRVSATHVIAHASHLFDRHETPCRLPRT